MPESPQRAGTYCMHKGCPDSAMQLEVRQRSATTDGRPLDFRPALEGGGGDSAAIESVILEMLVEQPRRTSLPPIMSSTAHGCRRSRAPVMSNTICGEA